MDLVELFTKDEQPSMAEFNSKIEGFNALTEQLQGLANEKARIQVVSYIGTGTGSAKVTFNFRPKVLFWGFVISESSTLYTSGNFVVWGLTNEYVTRYDGFDGGPGRIKYSFSGNTATATQHNTDGYTYYVVAIG